MAAPAYAKNLSQKQEVSKHDSRTCMLVIDPISRKLSIPYESIMETLARYRQGVPSLCMLYFNGRCRQGQGCHQVHADPSVVLALRTQAQKTLMCCKVHGDKAPMLPRYEGKYQVLFQGGSGTPLPINKVAMTHALQRYIDEYEQANPEAAKDNQVVPLSISATLICRLHGQDRCRFGSECKFIHICKELLWGEVSAAGMLGANSSTNGRRFSNSSNGPYQQQQQQQQSYQGDMTPPSPTHPAPYSSNPRGYYTPPGHMSCESLISMDLTATPPMTPTSDPMVSPVIKCKQAGDSWSYEPYGFNPIPMMPPTFDDLE